jgi:VanZ family protein
MPQPTKHHSKISIKKKLNNNTIAIAATISWAAIVFFLHIIQLDLPKDEPLFKIPHADKLVHLTMFAILSFLIGRCYETIRNTKLNIPSIITILIVCAAYGAILEWLQANRTTERSGDAWDWIADLIGIVIGLLIARSAYLNIFFQLKRRKAL